MNAAVLHSEEYWWKSESVFIPTVVRLTLGFPTPSSQFLASRALRAFNDKNEARFQPHKERAQANELFFGCFLHRASTWIQKKIRASKFDMSYLNIPLLLSVTGMKVAQQVSSEHAWRHVSSTLTSAKAQPQGQNSAMRDVCRVSLHGDECRGVLGKCLTTSAANIIDAIRKHVWVTCCFEVLGTHGFCIFLLSFGARCLKQGYSSRLLGLEVLVCFWATAQSDPSSRGLCEAAVKNTLHTKNLKENSGMIGLRCSEGHLLPFTPALNSRSVFISLTPCLLKRKR